MSAISQLQLAVGGSFVSALTTAPAALRKTMSRIVCARSRGALKRLARETIRASSSRSSSGAGMYPSNMVALLLMECRLPSWWTINSAMGAVRDHDPPRRCPHAADSSVAGYYGDVPACSAGDGSAVSHTGEGDGFIDGIPPICSSILSPGTHFPGVCQAPAPVMQRRSQPARCRARPALFVFITVHFYPLETGETAGWSLSCLSPVYFLTREQLTVLLGTTDGPL